MIEEEKLTETGNVKCSTYGKFIVSGSIVVFLIYLICDMLV